MYGLVNAPKKRWDRLEISLVRWIRALCPCQTKNRGVTGVHVEDLFGGGDEVFDRTLLEVRREFDFGAWDVGAVRFKRETVDTGGKW